MESLTSNPELENSLDPQRTLRVTDLTPQVRRPAAQADGWYSGIHDVYQLRIETQFPTFFFASSTTASNRSLLFVILVGFPFV